MLCTGDGLCAEIAPDVFEMHDDGLAYVTCHNKKGMCKDASGNPEHRMGGDSGLVDVPEHMLDAVVESAEECPG